MATKLICRLHSFEETIKACRSNIFIQILIYLFYSSRGFLEKFSVTIKITAPSIEEEPAEQVTDFALPPDFILKDKIHVIMM